MPAALTQAHIEGQVLIVTLQRPEVLNALNPRAHHELAEHFDAFEADERLRVAIITGAGTRAFCVGSDLREDLDPALKPASGFAGLSRRFQRAKPVIAAVNGLALGGGLEIVLACDLAVAADHARFGLPEPRVGLAAIEGGLQRLARQLPRKQANQLLLTGAPVDAAMALRFGLVNQVVPAAGLMAAALGYARDIIACSPLALATTQALVEETLRTPDIGAPPLWDSPAVARLWRSDDALEGLAAFAEKRPPRWPGR